MTNLPDICVIRKILTEDRTGGAVTNFDYDHSFDIGNEEKTLKIGGVVDRVREVLQDLSLIHI